MADTADAALVVTIKLRIFLVVSVTIVTSQGTWTIRGPFRLCCGGGVSGDPLSPPAKPCRRQMDKNFGFFVAAAAVVVALFVLSRSSSFTG